ncbi:hypothetical protein PF005_g27533 [Phytophthora fragariae]|uniref:Secreted protein n=1 Tax=Phytophthora fragariae TaxID=53985 RepID=A0A6A4BKQ6_9STRA|nr:hypothetical protein PF003_g34239 [Phytophthora fragariae]KAE8921535.1 hypothetical protein PF009_g28188 [Phytophthora fragariae]KAE8970046.1 hypothetical protein PF011_g26569 [Phytophthora fragariae]KAE9068922.1 hypothetical protein PF007_g27506 [Phytophthora fragariae]KAE9081499.1 hypothetical protein PF006_g27102 [Phytophthora fragariae]
MPGKFCLDRAASWHRSTVIWIAATALPHASFACSPRPRSWYCLLRVVLPSSLCRKVASPSAAGQYGATQEKPWL